MIKAGSKDQIYIKVGAVKLPGYATARGATKGEIEDSAMRFRHAMSNGSVREVMGSGGLLLGRRGDEDVYMKQNPKVRAVETFRCVPVLPTRSACPFCLPDFCWCRLSLVL